MTAQESNGIRNSVTTLTRLGGDNTREHHNKVASVDYRTPKSPNKHRGYGNLGIFATFILVASISKRLTTGESSDAKENSQYISRQ